MRLYDKLLAERGGYLDIAMQGAVTKLYPDLVKAQCFQMNAEVAITCAEISRAKPSTVLGAMKLMRTPFTHTWIEWSPNDREQLHYTRNNNKPIPKRVGMLLVTGDDCCDGWVMLAWEHVDDSLMMNPLGLCFNWRGDGKAAVESYARTHTVPDVANIVADKRQWLLNRPSLPDRWRKYNQTPGEFEAAVELELTANVIPLDACLEHLEVFNFGPGTKPYDSFVDDLSGELPFIEAFLLLLNSRNSIVARTREDLAKLNKARSKHKRPPLREFYVTTIKLNKVQSNRAGGTGASRHLTVASLVRGHFKVRKTGVFFWTPHVRGPGDVVKRGQYTVTR